MNTASQGQNHLPNFALIKSFAVWFSKIKNKIKNTRTSKLVRHGRKVTFLLSKYYISSTTLFLFLFFSSFWL